MTSKTLLSMMAVAAVAFSALYAMAVLPYWKITPDSMTYVEGAKSLAEGRGYREFEKPALLFPPGTSALLAVGWIGGQGSYRVLNAEVTLAALASAVLCFFVFRPALGIVGGGSVALLLLGSARVFAASTILLSDIFYLLFSMCVLWCYQRGNTTGTALSSLGAVMVRSAGVCLAMALLLDSLWRKPFRWSRVAANAIPLLWVALWELRNMRLGIAYSTGYLQAEPWVPSAGRVGFPALLARLAENLGYARVLEDLLTNGLTEEILWATIPGLVLLVLLIAGIRRLSFGPSGWKALPISVVYLLLYGVAIGFAPPPVPRYLLPLLPLFFAGVVAGAQEVIHRTKASWLYVPVWAVFVLYLVTGFRQDIALIASDRRMPFPNQQVWYSNNEDFQRVLLWWKAHSTETESYACQHPGIVRILVGRQGITYPLNQPLEKVEEAMMSGQARYLLLNLKSNDDLRLASMVGNSPRFQELRRERKAVLYAFSY